MTWRRRYLGWGTLPLMSAVMVGACGSGTHQNGDDDPVDILDQESPFVATAEPEKPIPCSAEDQAAAKAVWTTLRETTHPYHLQTLAMSPPFKSGCRALIIAEPPPSVTLDTIRAVAPDLFASSTLQRHKIGYDGWTQDVVVTLPAIADAERVELTEQLGSLMFGTTYGTDVLDTSQPVPRFDPKATSTDMDVTPSELSKWLLEEDVTFEALLGGDSVHFREMLNSNDPDVFIDSHHPLVVWLIPRAADIGGMQALFRKFTLESDVIIGAVASDKSVAVIARRRQVDPLLVQPLRFETVSLLAAVQKDHLQQSYDRTNVLAGRIDASRDWAPIFLSPELLDTEYGSILDITDQLLKSWSNNGKTQYINFTHPRPNQRWAFSAPVFVVAQASSFRYNWNTANVGAVINVDALDIFWLRRTGALNVSYFPDENVMAVATQTKRDVASLEEKAYRFFSSTQTPLLVRVVQYNALFQIFARFKLKSTANVSAGSNAPASDFMKQAVRSTLQAIRDADEGEIAQVVERFMESAGAVAEMKRRLREIAKSNPDLARVIDKMGQDWRAALIKTMVEKVLDVAQLVKSTDAQYLDELATVLGAPRDATELSDSWMPLYSRIRALGPLFAQFASPNTYERYAGLVHPKRDTWIHTPSIVISWNEPPIAGAIGGHDLEAKVANLRFDREAPNLASSQLMEGKHVEAVSAGEFDRLVLGQHGPTLSNAAVVRPVSKALGIEEQGRPWVARWKRPKGNPSASAPMDYARVKKVADGYSVVTPSGVSYDVTTMPEVVDLVASSRRASRDPMRIHLEGFREDEARGLVRSAEVRTESAVAGLLGDMPAFARQPLDFSRARVLEPRVRSFSDGAGEIGIQITVPTGGRQLWVRIKLAFRRATPEWLQAAAARVQEAVIRVMRRLRTRAVPLDVGVMLRQELRGLLPEVDIINVKLKQEVSDFTIVQREEPTCGTDRNAG